jgi:anti-sigma factor RsiW
MNQTHPTPDELVDYLHGELPAGRDAAIHAHLRDCSACAEARDAEVRITELLRGHAQAQERELPPSVISGILDAVEQRRSPAWSLWSAAFRPAIVMAATAAVVLLLYVGIHSLNSVRGRLTTTIDAAYYVNDHAALSAMTPFSPEDPIPPTLASDHETR